MDSPLFLTLDEVLQMHAYQVDQHGGDPQVLDLAKLESAIAQPMQAFGGQFIHDSLAKMAAAYLFYIVQNHAFADGNKRTGMHAAITFLAVNGYEDLEIPVDEAEELTLAVARGESKREAVAEFFEKLLAA